LFKKVTQINHAIDQPTPSSAAAADDEENED
jgi:hypothetical protein